MKRLPDVSPNSFYHLKEDKAYLYLTEALPKEYSVRKLKVSFGRMDAYEVVGDANVVGYLFKPKGGAKLIGAQTLVLGSTTTIESLTLKSVLSARIPIRLIYTFPSWTFFDYANTVEIVTLNLHSLTEKFES